MNRSVIRAGGSFTASSGGNGAADAGKVALFNESGGLAAVNISASGIVDAGSLSVGLPDTTAGIVTLWDNASINTVMLRPVSNLTGYRTIYLPDADGTLALTSQLPASGTQTVTGVTAAWNGSPTVLLNSSGANAIVQLNVSQGGEVTVYGSAVSLTARATCDTDFVKDAATGTNLNITGTGGWVRLKRLGTHWVVLAGYNITLT